MFDFVLFLFRSQIGRKRNHGSSEGRVEQLDDPTADLAVGSSFMAVSLANWDKIPVIGKVTAIEENSTIHYWKGGFNTE